MHTERNNELSAFAREQLLEEVHKRMCQALANRFQQGPLVSLRKFPGLPDNVCLRANALCGHAQQQRPLRPNSASSEKPPGDRDTRRRRRWQPRWQQADAQEAGLR